MSDENGIAVAEKVLATGRAMQRVETGYTTAIAVQRPRVLNKVVHDLNAEAMLSGESFYYGWQAAGEKIEGPSIKLANAAARCWGNCVIELLPIQELMDSWVFQAVFIDLETGFTTTRQFRQDKRSVVHGRHDEARKADIRFQIGQSKAIRNVILNALPSGLIDAAMEAAKNEARKKLTAFIEGIDKKEGAGKGLVKAVDTIVSALAKAGVREQAILSKLGIAERKAIDVDRLLILRGDLSAIDSGEARADELFPPAKVDQLTDKLAAGTEQKPAEPAPEKPKGRGKKAAAESQQHIPGVDEDPAQAPMH